MLKTFAVALAAGALATSALAVTSEAHAATAETPAVAPAPSSGVIRVKSALGFDDTVTRLKADLAAKGIRFFDEIDQSGLAAQAGIAIRPSRLLIFGNPPLGTQFLSAQPYAGLDWPVRMLVVEDAEGQVWVAWTDFEAIKRRHDVQGRDAQFRMASQVAASVAGAAAGR